MDKCELYLKTAFCCMACDGEIAEEEIAMLKRLVERESVFAGLDVQSIINEYVSSINQEGMAFLNGFIEEVKAAALNDDESLQLIRIAIEAIEADNEIEYSEISFFKRIRKQLSITDSKIQEAMPEKEDFFLPDIEDDSAFDWNATLGNIQLGNFVSK